MVNKTKNRLTIIFYYKVIVILFLLFFSQSLFASDTSGDKTETTSDVINEFRETFQKQYDEIKLEHYNNLKSIENNHLEFKQTIINWFLAILGIILAVFGIALPIKLSRDIDEQKKEAKKALDDFTKLNRGKINNSIRLYRQQLKDSIKSSEKEIEKFMLQQKEEINKFMESSKKEINICLEDAHKGVNEIKQKTDEAYQLLNLQNINNDSKKEENIEKAKDLSEDTTLPQYERDLAKAMELFYSDKYNKALEEFENLFKEYKKEITIKQRGEIYFFMGYSIMEIAETKEEEEREELYIEAIDKFKTATELNLNNDIIYNNWGFALENIADTKKGEKREELYREAIKKYKKAIEINPMDSTSYNSWGVNLGKIGDIKNEEEKYKTYKEAIIKFRKAIEINPENDMSYTNLVFALIKLSLFEKNNEKKNELLNEAEKILLKNVKLEITYYYFAYIYILKNDKDRAFEYLEKALIDKEITFDVVKNDKNFKDLRDDERYIELKKKYGNKEGE